MIQWFKVYSCPYWKGGFVSPRSMHTIFNPFSESYWYHYLLKEQFMLPQKSIGRAETAPLMRLNKSRQFDQHDSQKLGSYPICHYIAQVVGSIFNKKVKWGAWIAEYYHTWLRELVCSHYIEDKIFFGYRTTSTLKNFQKRTRSRQETQISMLVFVNYL